MPELNVSGFTKEMVSSFSLEHRVSDSMSHGRRVRCPVPTNAGPACASRVVPRSLLFKIAAKNCIDSAQEMFRVFPEQPVLSARHGDSFSGRRILSLSVCSSLFQSFHLILWDCISFCLTFRSSNSL